jgi:tetratricopeptide (TPR) repeat protein
MVLHAQRAYGEAAAEYRQALHHDDGYVDALTDLAWLLVTVDDPIVSKPDEGLTLAQRAAALTSPQTATVLDVLAAALAASGRFDDAVGRGEQALRLARAAKDEPLASAIDGRLTLYRQKQPFRSSR